MLGWAPWEAHWQYFILRRQILPNSPTDTPSFSQPSVLALTRTRLPGHPKWSSSLDPPCPQEYPVLALHTPRATCPEESRPAATEVLAKDETLTLQGDTLWDKMMPVYLVPFLGRVRGSICSLSLWLLGLHWGGPIRSGPCSMGSFHSLETSPLKTCCCLFPRRLSRGLEWRMRLISQCPAADRRRVQDRERQAALHPGVLQRPLRWSGLLYQRPPGCGTGLLSPALMPG